MKTLLYFASNKPLQTPLRQPLMALVAGLLLAVVVLLSTYYTTRQTINSKLEQEAGYHLARLKSKLDALLMRHAYLPVILARNPQIEQFLQTPHPTPEQQITLNRYLEELNTKAGTQDLYLKDTQGLTLAASNWQQPYSFIGNNYSFRPYFQQAMQGKLGRYFAMGSASNERGYYFSYAVRATDQTILGVITAKISISNFEQDWSTDRSPAEFMISDESGVIFMASQSAWSLHALAPLTPAIQQQVTASRRYNDLMIPPLSARPQDQFQVDTSHWQLAGNHYLQLAEALPNEDWTAHILLNRRSADQQLILTMLVASVLVGMTGLLVYLAWRIATQRRRYEQQVLEALEIKVEERTRELRQTQDELIQAAKMAALGQLAAGINHELNNPLSAIRAYADNAQQFMQLGKPEFVTSNLAEISQLTERMATITHQLKIFSRKSHGDFQACSIEAAVQSALLLMHPPIVRTHTQVQTHYEAEAPYVWADLVWLEQIIVNLISNALDATEGKPERLLIIKSSKRDTWVDLQIQDNGHGIKPEYFTHIFEAFFTTKSLGNGLGLGLSISYRLAKDMHGDLSVQSDNTGTIFTLTLPYHAMQALP